MLRGHFLKKAQIKAIVEDPQYEPNAPLLDRALDVYLLSFFSPFLQLLQFRHKTVFYLGVSIGVGLGQLWECLVVFEGLDWEILSLIGTGGQFSLL